MQKTAQFSTGPLSLFMRFWPVFLFLATVATILIKAHMTGKLGRIGPDQDDIMRLAQIKDFLAGQSWFHTDQYRMGLAGGTDMHWSRLPDVPVVLLYGVFNIVLPSETALTWAYTLWPPLSSGLLFAGVYVGARHWEEAIGQPYVRRFAMLITAVYVTFFFRFAPGAIDHHNVQLGLLTLSAGLAMDMKFRFKSFFWAGLCLALSIAVGVEVYIFAALICAYIAVLWWVLGEKTTEAARGFGLGLSVAIGAIFVLTIAPKEYGRVYCDALSLITLSAAVAGGAGLALLAGFAPLHPFFTKPLGRFVGLAGLGLFCLFVLSFQAPQCLVNPLDSLPKDVKVLWLDVVQEALPVTHKSFIPETTLPSMVFAPFIGLAVLVWMGVGLWRSREETGAKFVSHALLLSFVFILSGTALALTFYQVRFFPFAYIFLIVPFGAWVAQVFVKARSETPPSIRFVFPFLASLPIMWAVFGVLFVDMEKVEGRTDLVKNQKSCMAPEVISAIGELPQGTIMADPNMTGRFLTQTHHRVISGNYHRNWAGISLQIQSAVSEFEQAETHLRESGVDYVYFCATSPGTANYSRYAKNGLSARLSKGEHPDFLDVIEMDPPLGEGKVMFKFRH